MSTYFRAVAIDYDGTITLEPRPDAEMLRAIEELRASSMRVILVTGRILSELSVIFPEVYGYFDAIVGENGGVLWHDGYERELVAPVPEKLYEQLLALKVPIRRGKVILATNSAYDQSARDACVNLNLDNQLIRNRSELMILPAGISKGTGLREALGDLGISLHSTIGIGDAENDLALLEACEIGVAVGNALPSLKEFADVVLEDIGPPAVESFLRNEVRKGVPGVQPRHRVELGVAEDGTVASIPASGVQVFIDGPSGSGKSYIAGLLAEGLARMDYTACILDLEGDHGHLGDLRNVISLGGREPIPSPEQIARLIRHRFGSVVIDLSLREPDVKQSYVIEVIEGLTRLREECGLPHWIFLEEAHNVPSEAIQRARTGGSMCLVTYHPDWLPGHSLGDSDILITAEAPGCGRIRTQGNHSGTTYFQTSIRRVSHVRHSRKYADACVPYEKGFTFRNATGKVFAHASSLVEFQAEFQKVSPEALIHHARGHDFSRWFRVVYQDAELASATRQVEETFNSNEIEALRSAILELISLRYDLRKMAC